MTKVLKYLIRDLEGALNFLPYGIVVGCFCVLFLILWRNKRQKMESKDYPVAAYVTFIMYAAILLGITFLSRESGTSNVVDLKLFSTWGINARNNALVIENVLLFIPFGVTSAWAFKHARSLLTCTLFGALVSLGIETLQLVTGRGCFQIDDILTNTLGAALGYLFFRYVTGRFWKR